MNMKLDTPKSKAAYIMRNITTMNDFPYQALHSIVEGFSISVNEEEMVHIFDALMTEDRINPDPAVTLNCLRALDNLREG